MARLPLLLALLAVAACAPSAPLAPPPSVAEVEGVEHRLLFVHGRDIKARIIRTATGLISFGIELGVSPICIPLFAGERAKWTTYAGDPQN